METKNIHESMVYSDTTFTKRVLFADEHMLSFVLNFTPGQSLPMHKHEQSTLVAQVLSGSGELKINNDAQTIEPGSVIMAKGEDNFGIPRVDEAMSLFVTISPNPSNKMYSKDLG